MRVLFSLTWAQFGEPVGDAVITADPVDGGQVRVRLAPQAITRAEKWPISGSRIWQARFAICTEAAPLPAANPLEAVEDRHRQAA